MCSKNDIREVINEAGLVHRDQCIKTSNSFKMEIKLIKKDIKTMGEKQDQILKKLDEIEKKYAGKWTERWIIGVTIIFALSALYFMFKSVGLPY